MPLSIPLPILIGIIAAGFLLLLILLTATGSHARAVLSEAAALAHLRRDFAGHTFQSVALSDDQQVALASAAGSDAIGIVVVLGDKAATRMLAPAALRSVSADDTGLRLRIRDPGFPSVRVVMADAGQRARWLERLTIPPRGSHGDS